MSLPAPSPEQLEISQRLVRRIRSEIETAGGWVPFARYMELALYTPGLGYYAGGSEKFGTGGDFVTAPQISPLFGRVLARQFAEVLQQTGGGILELGAGTGLLAAQIIGELRAMGMEVPYSILEVSGDLRARQRERLKEFSPSPVKGAEAIQWLDALPEKFAGVIFGNEVLDALPLHLVHWTKNGPLERGVRWETKTAPSPLTPPLQGAFQHACWNRSTGAEHAPRIPRLTPQGEGEFAWEDRPITDPALLDRARALELPTGYVSEINLAATALVKSLAERLESGLLFFIDYGFGRSEYYHPQRHMGTLRAHFRHHALDDPFHLPGLCDLTAHVDFTAVADAGLDAGLDVCGYATQANFLLAGGITALLAETPADAAASYLPLSGGVQKLLSPAEMGELFKVIGMRKKNAPCPGAFALGDQRYRL